MKDNFRRSLGLVRISEGGNDNDRDDPGGRTSRGITQKEYDAYCRLRDLPAGDVWNASDEDVDRIYYDGYWLPYCEQFPLGVDYAFFDMRVNHGGANAARILQRALVVDDDSFIGVITLAALAKADPVELLNDIAFQRKRFYRTARGYWKFGKGWLNRNDFVQRRALLMITGAAPVAA